MSRKRKNDRGHDVTARYLAGDDFDQDKVETGQRFSNRNKTAEQDKILRTTAMRAAEEGARADDLDSLPIGRVTQVYSLFCEVIFNDVVYLCLTRKTLTKISDTAIVVGDRVRFRESGTKDELGRPEAIIEQLLPRDTILTRADSFKGLGQHPIVANAQQMLIVASLLQPDIKWGLIDRMLVAAQSGKLSPIICLNKIDLAGGTPKGEKALHTADEALTHYESLGARTLRASVAAEVGLSELREMLQNQTTVLAGHSGVGKSSLINAIQPHLDLRVGEVSHYTDKGRHTTTSARRYPLDFGGEVIDTPGVKMFGLWGVTRENLDEFFPDVDSGAAPTWRVESYERISKSLLS